MAFKDFSRNLGFGSTLTSRPEGRVPLRRADLEVEKVLAKTRIQEFLDKINRNVDWPPVPIGD